MVQGIVSPTETPMKRTMLGCLNRQSACDPAEQGLDRPQVSQEAELLDVEIGQAVAEVADGDGEGAVATHVNVCATDVSPGTRRRTNRGSSPLKLPLPIFFSRVCGGTVLMSPQ